MQLQVQLCKARKHLARMAGGVPSERSRIIKAHYPWPEDRRWDYLHAIVLHLEYSREFNQILEQSMRPLQWTPPMPLEPKECSETIALVKRVTLETSSWRMRLTSHPPPARYLMSPSLSSEHSISSERQKHLGALISSRAPPPHPNKESEAQTGSFFYLRVDLSAFSLLVGREQRKL